MINTIVENGVITVKCEGRIEGEILNSIESAARLATGTNGLVLDFSGVGAISDEGMSLLLLINKRMSAHGGLIIKNVCEKVYDALENEGITNILTIKKRQ